jgi:hypothetical protein
VDFNKEKAEQQIKELMEGRKEVSYVGMEEDILCTLLPQLRAGDTD